MNDVMSWLRQQRWLPWLLSVVFFSLILLNIWSVTYLSVPVLEESVLPLPESPQQDKGELLRSLQHPVFGAYVPKVTNEAAISASTLDVKIVGIVYSSTAEESQVLVELADGEQKSFHVGDVLPGDAQIKKITHDGMLIWYNNRLERIELSKEELNFSPPAVPMSQDSL
ncbi:MAG: hypothetical protein JJT82_09800 [Legionellaceae bacterium]|nr:hypothetical protein [Legionellaceae bacterium]